MPVSRRTSPAPEPTFRRRHRLLAPTLAISVLGALIAPTAGALATTEHADGDTEAAAAATPEPWTYQRLGQLPRESSEWQRLDSAVHAINDTNVAVGGATVGYGDQERTTTAVPGGPLRQLVDGLDARATGINDRGEAVGVLLTGDEHRGLLVRDGLPITLTDLGGYWNGATDINEHSTIVGYGSDPASPNSSTVPTRWQDPEQQERLPMPAGWYAGRATAINDAGTIVGTATKPDHGAGSLIWSAGAVREIPNMIEANDVNADATAVGASAVWGPYGTETIPVVSRNGGSPTRLPVTSLYRYGTALGINDRGDVVGRLHINRYNPLFGNEVGVVWPAEGGVEIIQEHLDGPAITSATDINEHRWITTRSEDAAQSYAEGVLVRIAPPGARLLHAELQRPDLPSGEWGAAPPSGVHEGTAARWVAEVENPSDDPHVVQVELVDRATGERVQDLVAFESIAPGATAEIELDWATDGLAWDPSGQPTPAFELDLVVSADGTEMDRQEFDTTVLPRPMVLVHGFNADATTWENYPAIVRAHHPRWQVFAVGDGQAPGRMNTGSLSNPFAMPNTIYENAQILSGYLDAVRADTDAAHVDIVAHSMGGLISRQYVQAFMPEPVDGDPVVDHLVMLGTPNHGSPCAAILPLAGMYELRPEAVNDMNRYVTDRRGVDMSVLAGTPVPFTCQESSTGDGVVSYDSATSGWQDTAVSDRVHTGLTGGPDFAEFVLPRLIQTSTSAARQEAAANPTASTAAAAVPTQLARTEVVRVGAREELLLPIESGDAGRVGVAIAADPRVHLALRSPTGSGEGLPDEQTANPVRSIVSRDDEFVAGTWRAYLWNESTEPIDVTLTMWVEGGSTVLDGAATARRDGSVDVSATLRDAAGPVDGATVSARLLGTDGSNRELQLDDDGSGSHLGRTEPLPEGAYVVELVATAPAGDAGELELRRSVLTSVVVGAPAEPDPDVLAPRASVSAPTAPGSGWHREPVSVRIDATDVGETASGVASIDWHSTGASTASGTAGADGTDVVVDTDGTTTVTATALDHAGNRSEPATTEVRVDRANPTISVASPTPGARVAQHGRLVATYTCTDATSGVASCQGDVTNGSPLPTSTVGTHQFTVTATDHAGNTTTSTLSYTVTAAATPAQLFDRLAAEVRAAKLGWAREPALLAPLAAARSVHKAPWTPLSCIGLAIFGGLTELYTTLGWLPANHATTLRTTLGELRTTLRC